MLTATYISIYKRFLLSSITIFIFGCVVSAPSTDQLNVTDSSVRNKSKITHNKNFTNEKLNKVKLPFIENKGQFNPEVKFYANTFAGTVYVTDTELVYDLPFKEKVDEKVKEDLPSKGVILREKFLDSKIGKFSPEGNEKSEAVFSSFIGNDKSKWVRGSSTYDSVKVGEPWEGIKLELHAYGNNVEKLFTIEPGINPENIALSFEGAKYFKVDASSGELVVTTELGNINFTKPIAYQFKNEKKEEVKVAYVSKDSGYGFEVGSYDNNIPLIIDPLLASTYVGGTSNEVAYAIAIDASGNVFVTGSASGSSYPATTGAYDETHNGGTSDVFVSKLNSSLTTLSASTFIGGSGDDQSKSIAIDSSGNVFVTGFTNDSSYPTTAGAYDETQNGNYDAFVSKLNSSLTTLSASTFIGANGSDTAYSIAIDASDNIFVTGVTTSASFPTTAGVYDQAHYTNGTNDVFVSKFNSTLTTLSASTFIGGSGSDTAYALVIDTSGNIFIAGQTSSGYPTTSGAYDEIDNGGNEIFVSKLNSTLTTLSASTYLGGSGSDTAYALAIDTSGNVFVTGNAGTGYPTTTGAYDETQNGNDDAFVSKLNSTLTTLSASTFIGGSGYDYGYSIAIDASGNVFVTGATTNSSYPTTSGAYDQIYNGSNDIYVSKLNSSLTTLSASTFIGGSGFDLGYALALDTSGNVFVAGYANSGYPTTTGAYDQTHNGANDVYVAELDSNLSTAADTTAPTVTNVTSSTSNGSYKSGDSISIQITFDEVVTVTGTPLLTLETGSTVRTINYVSGSGGTTLTFTYTVQAGDTSADLDYVGTSSLTLNSGTIRDAALNNATLTLASPGASGSLGNNKAIVIDTTAPSVSITSSASNPTNTSPISVTITFSESVTGFVVGDITVGNGIAGNFAGSGTTYSVNITPSAQGAVTVDVSSSVAADAAANGNTAATQLSRTYDSIAPTVSITSSASNSTNTSLIPVTITFNESVTGFIVGDITVGNGTAGNFSGSGTTYTANITPSAQGAVTVNVSSSVATDTAGNNNSAATQLSRTYDSTAPTVAITSSASGSTHSSPIPVTITFNESVTGFVVGDITVGNGTAGSFAGSGTTYAAEITPTEDGTVTVNVTSSVASDTAGNSNSSASQFSITYDASVEAPDITTEAGTRTSYLSNVEGTAEAETTVEVFDNLVSIGTVDTDDSGDWSLSLSTPLDTGSHSLTAVATDSGSHDSDSSEAVLVTILGTVLDFDSDGVSDVSLFKKTKTRLTMQITSSSDSSVNLIDVIKPNAQPAPGDYNGNGKTEVAVISKGAKNVLDWSFVDEDTGAVTTESFGKFSDYVITGCNFDSSIETEMAYIRKNALYFKHHNSSSVTKKTLPATYKPETLLGCGDLNQDGVSELLFEKELGKKKNKTYNFVAINLSGQIVKQLTNVGNLRLAYVEDATGDETADLLFKIDKQSTLDIWDGSSDENTADVTVSNVDNFSIGISKNLDNDYLGCLIEADIGGTVFKTYLKSGDDVSTEVTLGTYRFAVPVNVYKPSLVLLK